MLSSGSPEGPRRTTSWQVRRRVLLAAATALALVVSIGAGVSLSSSGDGSPGDGSGPGLASRLWDAARGMVGGGAPSGEDRAGRMLAGGPGLAVDEPAPTGERWPAQKRVRELPDRATANARFFQLSDGRVQAEISSTPVNYRDGKGRWRPIDTSVSSSGRAGFPEGNTTNTFTSLFGDSTDRLVRFERDGRWLQLGLAGAPRKVSPRVDGSTVTYPNVLGDGVDLVYEVTSTALKEQIVLRKAPHGPVSFTFRVNSAGLVAHERGDGSIGFSGHDDRGPVVVLPAPFMFDDHADKASPYGKTWSGKVSQRLRRMYGQTSVTVSADGDWLTDPARVYPVTIDPTVKIQPVPADSQDVEIYSGNAAANYNSSYQLRVGTDSTDAWRTMVRFPLTAVPANTQLDDARLEMYYDQTHYAWGYDVSMEARRVTADWDESTATWASMNANMAAQAAGNVVTVDDGDAGTSMVGSWPYSGNTALTPLAVGGDYRYNNDTTSGNTHTWVPTLTESGDYQVEVHYVSASDRTSAAKYTVYYAGGSKTYTVDQTGSDKGEWKTLGVLPFNAGSSHKVVLADDGTGDAVIADAVRFTRWGVATKKSGVSSVWSSFPVRNVVQDWINGTYDNDGFMVKAVDEGTLGRGGPIFEASEYAYLAAGRQDNQPKLVLTWGRPAVTLSPPTTVTATGALLNWSAYQDPSSDPGDDIVEYQVHRSIYQTYTPSAATLVAPVSKDTLSFQDTTATPTPADTPDTELGAFYYYTVAVKTADGEVIPTATQGVRLPKAGQITRVYRSGVTDTTLASGQPNSNVDVYDGDPYVSAGNNSSYYGDARALVKFPDLTGIPGNAQVVKAKLRLWNTYQYPGTSASDYVDAHRLTRAFDETTATWNNAAAGTPWTSPGGDYDPNPLSQVSGITNDPEWESWNVKSAVDGWLANPSANYGLLVKMHDESVSTARAMLLSSEGAEPLLRPTLQVTYLQPTAESTYYAPTTPARMIPGDTYTIPVTVSNPTQSTWTAADWELSYHWALPDGTDVTNGGNQLATPLPADVPPLGTVDISAQLKTPIQSDAGNKRTDYVLGWELHNKTTGQWLSATSGIAALTQNVAVEDPTSDQLGLEKFYSYAGKNTGAGGVLMDNLYAGNTVWSYNAFTNPSRGLATFVRLAYNSLDTSDTVAGYGWSLQASSLTRLGTPLDFHPNPNPTTVTLTDGDGTSHIFSWDSTTSTWISPKGVHLYLQQQVDCGPKTEEDRAWVLTKPDRTQFFYDCDGYLSAVADNNGNELLFTYAERKSQNKPTKFLAYITDPAGRQTLTVNYWAKGDDYDYIDDTTWTKQSATNLTNPHIIDHVRSITDISGRTLTFTYTDKGLLGELVDGAGSVQPKVFAFAYDMTQGNKNVKLVKVTDPRGNSTSLDYYYPQTGDDPQMHWRAKTYTDRLGNPTSFAYTDPDGTAGSTMQTVVTDAENHASTYVTDGYGRPTQITNAKNETTTLGWDADNNVTRLEEANGAVSTWSYDAKTGFPLEIKTAEANANGWPGTTLTYQAQLDGHVADMIQKVSPEGHKWTFGYTTEGDLAWVVDPVGNTTATADDYKTSYTYDTYGQMLTATDANGHTTTNGGFDDNGYPQAIVDALNNSTHFVYDERGHVTEVTDALLKTITQAYDVFGRPLEKVEPMDTAAGRTITTPAPEYDANDNVTTSTAPNGAVTTAVYDAADQLTYTLAPKDDPADPERRSSYTYDKVGNLRTTTEPKGNLTSTVGDYTTTNNYDEIYQLTSVVNAAGYTISYRYDNVGNVTTVIDPRKNATADTGDYSATYTYDLVHRVKTTTDAMGKVLSSTYDKDGLVTSTTDQAGNTITNVRDARGMPIEVRLPHSTDGGTTITYRTTKYEYDEVGNRTKVISPRGVATTDDADDFATVTVYDELNRPKETWTAYDKDDTRYTTPDKTIYTYDKVGRLATMSAPPSAGQTVRNDTTYTYYDNGWTRTTTDPWNIITSYDYNDIGKQTLRTLTPGGESPDTSTANRNMTWSYYPDGKLATHSDDGVPVGKQIVVVDNSDFNNTTATGTWTTVDTATGLYGHDYATHPAGTGTDSYTWHLNIPQAGSYQVFVHYPQISGAATDAKYTVAYDGGSTVTTVDQTANTGTWMSLGSYTFSEGNSDSVALSDQASGTVVADAVKLVRDNSGEADNEKHDYSYRYDPNGNLSTISDASPNARVDTYAVTYTGLNQAEKVVESKGGTTTNTTSFTYNENGILKTVTHDKQYSAYAYDARDLVSKVTNGKSASDPSPKVTTYTYTDRGERLHEVKGNGNTVDYTYYLDGLLKTQVEKKPNGALVADHAIEYDLNGNRTRDTVRKMNADDHTATLTTTSDYTYDPRDRVATVTKTGDGAGSESYIHDANNNVIEQTVGGSTTTFNYERNRLLTATTAGVTSSYNYDPYGRLDTVTSGGTITERNVYDGFDHIIENRKTNGGTTKYTYDPLDRTATKTTNTGETNEKTTVFSYLGLSNEVLDEEVAGKITKSYQYSPWGQRLSQIKHNSDGTEEDTYYGYNPHSDVEQITDDNGDTKATYGYTAYGNNDDAQFTGIDKPDTADPTKEPYNAYRFNAKRWDPNSKSYDMGFRNYSPGLNRFLSRDSYNGALADMNLGLNPFTGNRYAFGGGNPISSVEIDGHFALALAALAAVAVAALEVVAVVLVVAVVVLAVAAVAEKVHEKISENSDEADGTEPAPKPSPRPVPRPLPTDDETKNKGCGWVDYGKLDKQNGNRATGVKACLDKSYVASHPGSTTTKSVSPPGYQWARRAGAHLGAFPLRDNINKCHLLGDQLSGSGTDLRNLATCARGANTWKTGSSQGSNNMAYYENQVAAAVEKGQEVYYEVTPTYSGSRTVPTSFHIVAHGTNPDGSPGISIDKYVNNTLMGRNLGTFNDPNSGQPVPTGSMS